MNMSGAHRLSDLPLQTYSLDSLNEFLKMETATKGKRTPEMVQSQCFQSEEAEEEKAAVMQSAYSFAKKDSSREAPVR